MLLCDIHLTLHQPPSSLPVPGPALAQAHDLPIRGPAVWTEEGELFTFGNGNYGVLGHGGTQNEYVPRLVEALTEV